MDEYGSLAEFTQRLKQGGIDTRAIAFQYINSSGRRNIVALIEAQKVSGQPLNPGALNPAGETHTTIRRHGNGISLGTEYVLSANGRLYLAQGIKIGHQIGRDNEDEHKFYGYVEPTGTTRYIRMNGNEILRLQKSTRLVDILAEQ